MTANITSYFIIFSVLIAVSNGCTDHRDLYIESLPRVLIENNWAPSRITTENGATVMIYNRSESPVEFIPDGTRKLVKLQVGAYDMLVFNGLMYSPDYTHLENIRFRGTDRFETFEAYAVELPLAVQFRPSNGERIANNPDWLATRSTAGLDIDGRDMFILKYQNGVGISSEIPAVQEDTLMFSPCRVTQSCRVIVHAINPQSARIIRGSVRGFSESVFLANRMPSHTRATHQFILDNLRYNLTAPTIGTISSPEFTTFGPPLDLPDRTYELELNILLINGDELPAKRFDITPQINRVIERLRDDRLNNRPISEEILIEVSVALPENISDNSDITIGDWGNNILIPVPMNEPINR